VSRKELTFRSFFFQIQNKGWCTYVFWCVCVYAHTCAVKTTSWIMPVCRHWAKNGSCQLGAQCPFSHAVVSTGGSTGFGSGRGARSAARGGGSNRVGSAGLQNPQGIAAGRSAPPIKLVAGSRGVPRLAAGAASRGNGSERGVAHKVGLSLFMFLQIQYVRLLVSAMDVYHALIFMSFRS